MANTTIVGARTEVTMTTINHLSKANDTRKATTTWIIPMMNTM